MSDRIVITRKHDGGLIVRYDVRVSGKWIDSDRAVCPGNLQQIMDKAKMGKLCDG